MNASVIHGQRRQTKLHGRISHSMGPGTELQEIQALFIGYRPKALVDTGPMLRALIYPPKNLGFLDQSQIFDSNCDI